MDVVVPALLVGLSIAVGLAMTQYGPVLYGDTFTFINVAQNMINGRGWVTDVVSAGSFLPWQYFTDWAPLYPLLLAAGLHLGLEAELSLRLLAVIGYALLTIIVWLSTLYISQARWAAAIAAVVVMTFPAVMNLQPIGMPELLFMAASLASAYALIRHLARRRPTAVSLLSVSACLLVTTLLRYPGLVYLLTTLFIVSYYRVRRGQGRWLPAELTTIALAGVPVLLWLLRGRSLGVGLGAPQLHNNGTWLSQLHSIAVMLIRDWSPQLGLGGQRALSGLVTQAPLIIPAAMVLVLLLGAALLWRYRGSLAILWSDVWSRGVGILIAFFVAHTLFMTYYQVVSRPFTFEERHFWVTYPFLLVTIVCLAAAWWQKTQPTMLKLFPLLLLLIYFPAQVVHSVSGVQTVSQGLPWQVAWRESPTCAVVRNIVRNDDLLYSSAGTLMWYCTQYPTRFLAFAFPPGGETPCSNLPQPVHGGRQVFGLLKWVSGTRRRHP